MPLPKFLEEAVKEVVLSAPLEDWPTRRKRLIDFGLRGEVVDLHVQDIRSYANHIVQKSKSMPRPIPKQGNLPPSPESESSPPRYTTDPNKFPNPVFLLLQGLDNSVKSETIGCDYSEEEESIICLTALESRGLQSLIKDNMIRLVWHKPQECGKVHPTWFRVVSDEEERELMCADIRFGKNWLKGAPLEIETPAMAGKRKRSQGEIDEAERARDLTRQPRTFNPGMGDPGDPNWFGIAIGTATGQALRTFYGVPNPRYASSGHTEGIVEDDSQSSGSFHCSGQSYMQQPPD